MHRVRDALLDAYWWIVCRDLCPCSFGGPAWARRLCGHLDAAWWRYREPAG